MADSVDNMDQPIYVTPAHAPHKDLAWVHSHLNSQSLQFMVDCLPLLRNLLRECDDAPDLRVLDVGVASGAGSNLLASIYTGGTVRPKMHVDAIELEPDFATYAKAMFPSINYIVGNVLELEPEQPYDLVICSHTIEHIEHPLPFIQHLQTLASRYVLIYCPWKERQRIPDHLSTVDESLLQSAGAVQHQIIRSPAWLPMWEPRECVAFAVAGRPVRRGTERGPFASSVAPVGTTERTPFQVQPDGSSAVSIHGAGFRKGAVVEADGVALKTTFGSAGWVTATIPEKLYERTGTIQLRIANPDGKRSEPLSFRVLPS